MILFVGLLTQFEMLQKVSGSNGYYYEHNVLNSQTRRNQQCVAKLNTIRLIILQITWIDVNFN